MIAILRTKTNVTIQGGFLPLEEYQVYAKLMSSENRGSSYVVKGYYYRLEEVENEAPQEIKLKGAGRNHDGIISEILTADDVSGLFDNMTPEYPENATKSQRDDVDAATGLLVKLGTAGHWNKGLGDWEIVFLNGVTESETQDVA